MCGWKKANICWPLWNDNAIELYAYGQKQNSSISSQLTLFSKWLHISSSRVCVAIVKRIYIYTIRPWTFIVEMQAMNICDRVHSQYAKHKHKHKRIALPANILHLKPWPPLYCCTAYLYIYMNIRSHVVKKCIEWKQEIAATTTTTTLNNVTEARKLHSDWIKQQR